MGEGVDHQGEDGGVGRHRGMLHRAAGAHVLDGDVGGAVHRRRRRGLHELVGAAVEARVGHRPRRLVPGVQGGDELRRPGHLVAGRGAHARRPDVGRVDPVVGAGQHDVVVDQAPGVGPPLQRPSGLEAPLAVAHHVDQAAAGAGHGPDGVDDVLTRHLDVVEGPVGQVNGADVVAHRRQHLGVVPAPVELTGGAGAVDEEHGLVVGVTEAARAAQGRGQRGLRLLEGRALGGRERAGSGFGGPRDAGRSDRDRQAARDSEGDKARHAPNPASLTT